MPKNSLIELTGLDSTGCKNEKKCSDTRPANPINVLFVFGWLSILQEQ